MKEEAQQIYNNTHRNIGIQTNESRLDEMSVINPVNNEELEEKKNISTDNQENHEEMIEVKEEDTISNLGNVSNIHVDPPSSPYNTTFEGNMNYTNGTDNYRYTDEEKDDKDQGVDEEYVTDNGQMSTTGNNGDQRSWNNNTEEVQNSYFPCLIFNLN